MQLEERQHGEEGGEQVGRHHLPALALQAQVKEGDEDSGEGGPATEAGGEEEAGQQDEEEDDFKGAHGQ